MRVHTASSATVGVDVDLVYECSACGTKNVSVDRITVTEHTPVLFGFSLRPRFQTKAQEKLHELVVELVEQKNTSQIPNAGFSCRCQNCHHQEPWATPLLEQLETRQQSASFLLALGIFMALVSLSSMLLLGSFDSTFMVCSLISLGLSGTFFCYLSFLRQERVSETLALPKASIPLVLLHSSHNLQALREKIYTTASKATSSSNPSIAPFGKPQTPPAGGWVCTCGRAYAAYVSSCVCGVSKQEAKLQAAKSHENTNS